MSLLSGHCRFCMSRKGGMRGGGWVHPKGENGASQALGSLWSTPLGAERATCHVVSMNDCRKQSFPIAAPPNCMFTTVFCARVH